MSSSKGEHRVDDPTFLIICTLYTIIVHIDLSLLGAFLPPRRYIPGAGSRAGSIHALVHFLKIFLYKKNGKITRNKKPRQSGPPVEKKIPPPG